MIHYVLIVALCDITDGQLSSSTYGLFFDYNFHQSVRNKIW
jgi:hypothetical protein